MSVVASRVCKNRFGLVFATLLSGCAAAFPAVADMSGAGSTFVQPIMLRWADAWGRQSGAKVTYSGVGSGAGVEQLVAGKVDFAASDAPLSEEDLAKNRFTQFPIVAGGIVVVANMPGERKRVQFSGPLLAQVFLGQITKWNDPALQAANAGMTLPDQPITVVHRSDSSGITYNLTAFLSRVSPAWAEKYGTNKLPQWPAGVPAKGNDGVGQKITQTPYSIGYVEYGYALEHNMSITGLRNSAGATIAPTQTTISNAVAAADWESAPHFSTLLSGVQDANAWPIAAVTWVVMPRTPRKMAEDQGTLDFFTWVLRNGATLADAQGYTPMPERVVKLVEAAWAKEVTR
ncbi:phosphate ABC transporter substrate-binding protein PstS [Tahibacter amnicola]|uniref:Phosphate-binding protein PstS n=1 Tax=Tahibacter amnicola TaxID=2976241 RepID=A0ABY6BIV8_9GAMM|nr:phosphate ABC transporter substrate-binding protein PstS [Tahibacter amnicola]UXI69692.1 phosphate ABC transporter substrate-binding protein PstS [Tahibacter amnicola]